MKFISKSLPGKEISHISFLKKLHLEVDLLDDADQQTVHVVVQGRAHLQGTDRDRATFAVYIYL